MLGPLGLSPTGETACNYQTDNTFPKCFDQVFLLFLLLDVLNKPAVTDVRGTAGGMRPENAAIAADSDLPFYSLVRHNQRVICHHIKPIYP